ncbi:homeobox protein 4 [Stemphylium lycopersici]|uniref:Homeobox protein 4 n=1 Tax=Stemphylium lycopersici TaxID=183478 RepID=A0A364NBP7_STELY|nr:homeobox protein 4 [Stemphylium lycopersici]RAR14617.1 homeobox protein 4 [Stemphylium lycopersici]
MHVSSTCHVFIQAIGNMNDESEHTTGHMDPFFSFANDNFDPAHDLNDSSFAGLSEALAAANATQFQFNESWMTEPSFRDLSNHSTASSSPFTPDASISRPKLGSRFSREVIRTLKDWLAVHQQHPYPNENEMLALQGRTGLNKAQLTNWFANARRRGKVQSVRSTSPQVHNKPTAPIEIIPRPGTPAVRMMSDHKDPMQRWVESPPEHEPAAASDIARAMASNSHEDDATDFDLIQSWQSPYAMSSASSARTSHSKPSMTGNATKSRFTFLLRDGYVDSMVHDLPKKRMVGYAVSFAGKALQTMLTSSCIITRRVKNETFKNGHSTAKTIYWQGDWGFDSSVAPLVETAIPPDLIDWERGTLIPMKGSDPSWGTPPNAYELLKIEIEFFIQRYFDKHGHLPDNDAIQLEACRIIFAAETTSVIHTPGSEILHKVSWLRDLVMSAPELTEHARFQPMRSSHESRHFPLRINAKDHPFEHCPMEAQLRDFVTEQTMAGRVIDDTQLHNEACQIVRRMEQETSTPSDVFANWIVKGIYSGTDWLSNFKQRAGIVGVFNMASISSVKIPETWSGVSWPQLPQPKAPTSALGTSPSKQTHDFFTPLPSFSEDFSTTPIATMQPDTYGRLRTLLPDDTNFYRAFDSDMRRWAASTLSPKNPNCHIPSDEEIQHQARWIMYDGDDPWNQTPADFPKWLSRFKKDVGIAEDVEVVDPKELAMPA